MHTYYSDDNGMSPKFIGLFQCHPAMKKIYGYAVGSQLDEGIPEETLTSLPPGISNITHLELKDCRLRTIDLGHVLRATKNLKTFIYKIGLPMLSFCDFSTLGLQQALRAVEHSLENLWIDCGRSDFEEKSELNIIKPMSFTSFISLKFLRIATIFITGESPGEHNLDDLECLLDSRFPSRLETLDLFHYADQMTNLMNAIDRLLGQKKLGSELTHLREVNLKGRCPFFSPENLFETLRRTAKGVGIDVTLTHYEEEPSYLHWEKVLWGMNRDIEWASRAT